MADGKKLCRKCGLLKPVSEFYLSRGVNPTSPCKACCALNVAKWKKGHREQTNALNRKSTAKRYSENKKKRLESHRKWIKKNPDKSRAIDRRFRERHPDVVNANSAVRRAAKRNAIPSWSNKQYIDDMYMLAQLVSEFTGEQYHVDHIVPLTAPLVCGLHVEHNLQVIPAVRNHEKNNRVWPDMP